MYRIGQVSKILGISVQTIRYYEKYGLITPDEVCPESGYRSFSYDSLCSLWRINILKSAGFSLKEIKELSNLGLTETEFELKRKKDELLKLMDMQKYALMYIDKNLSAIKDIQNSSEDDYSYRYIPDRKGIKIDLPDSTPKEERFSTLSRVQVLYGMNQEVLFQPSRKISLNSSKYELNCLLALYRDDCHSFDNEIVQSGGLYFTKKITGPKQRQSTINAILAKIQADGYTLRGDGIEILIFDETLSNNRKTFLTEIQIAVEKK